MFYLIFNSALYMLIIFTYKKNAFYIWFLFKCVCTVSRLPFEI